MIWWCNTLIHSFTVLSATVMHVACLWKEDDAGVRWISVLANVADQLYYPCEHIAWAADAKLIKLKSDKWWLFSTVLWGTSLLLGILRSEIICPQTSNQINCVDTLTWNKWSAEMTNATHMDVNIDVYKIIQMPQSSIVVGIDCTRWHVMIQ